VATKEKQRAIPLSFAQGIGPPETSSLSTVGWTSSDFSQKEGVSKLTRWWIGGKSNQFQLANEELSPGDLATYTSLGDNVFGATYFWNKTSAKSFQ
jgi:hypothetical protein